VLLELFIGFETHWLSVLILLFVNFLFGPVYMVGYIAQYEAKRL